MAARTAGFCTQSRVFHRTLLPQTLLGLLQCEQDMSDRLHVTLV